MAQHAKLRFDGTGHLLLRPAQSVAAWNQREHQRPAAPILAQREGLHRHSPDELAAVPDALNGRPRKTLGWKTRLRH